MSCEISNLPKYQKRKSPSIPANDCELGTIEPGNDGNLWQIVSAGKSQRWVKCGTGSSNCGEYSKPSKKIIKPSKKTTKSTKKECPAGKVLNPKTGRCIKSKEITKKTKKNTKSTKKECPAGKVLNPKTGRCIKSKATTSLKTKKNTKSTKKECPAGKVLNPTTGRCIKSKETKKSHKISKKSYDYDDEWALEEDKYVDGIPTKSQMNKRRKYIDDIYKYQNQLVKLGADEYDAPPPETWRDPPQYCYNTQLEGMVSVMKDTLNDFKLRLKSNKTQVKKSVKKTKVTEDSKSCVSAEWRLDAGLPPLPKKYLNRPGPPYPAGECNEGDIKMGNDGNLYQNLLTNGRGGKILKWVKCGRAGTNC